MFGSSRESLAALRTSLEARSGDQYAAGVLYGITHGLSFQESAKLGNLCAGEVISHIGPRPEANLRELALAAGLKV